MTIDIQALILAAGKQTRWEINRRFPTNHKQLLRIGNERIIDRIVRQCHNRDVEPLIITQYPAIEKAVDVVCIKPQAHRWTVETLQYSPWGPDRTVVLLGDVVYSRDLMDRIFSKDTPLVIYGHLYEMFAVSFNSTVHQRMNDALQLAINYAQSGGKGKLRMLYNALRGVDLNDSSIEGELLSYVDYTQDYTQDVDMARDYIRLLNRVVCKGLINDE